MSGKQSKPKVIADDIEFDSDLELEFYHWCKEAQELELLAWFEYHPEPFELTPRATFTEEKQLKTKVKIVEKTLLQPWRYTVDFVLCPTEKLSRLFHGLRFDEFIFVDVKGTFNRFGGDRSFAYIQKVMYYRYSLYINKVVPDQLFSKSFVPQVCLCGKKGRIRSKYANFDTKHTLKLSLI